MYVLLQGVKHDTGTGIVLPQCAQTKLDPKRSNSYFRLAIEFFVTIVIALARSQRCRNSL